MTIPREMRTKAAVSAGGVVYRRVERGIEFVLCARASEKLWALPKGTPMPGESLTQTAEREVREETGLGVMIVTDLGTIHYSFSRPSEGVRYEKIVHHYLMIPDGTGSTSEHDQEYDAVAWFEAVEAARIITHANEREVLQRALDAIEPENAA